MRKKWTDKDVEFLKENYGTKTAQELADYFEVSKQAIIDKCRKCGISAKMNRREFWTKEEDELLKQHFEYAPKHYIEKLFPNRTWTSILQRGLKTLNLNRLSQDRYYIDYKFFETWNEQTAYMIGFIMADGYLKYKDKNRGESSLQFELAEYDRDILDKFVNILQYEGSVNTSKRNTVKLFINNKKIIEDLINKGVPSKNKTFSSCIPKDLPDELFRHFLRGLFDGDGSICLDKNNSLVFSLLGTEQLMYECQNKISELSPIDISNLKIYNRNNHGCNVYNLQFHRKSTLYFYDWLYKDSTIYLDRKYKKYITFKRNRGGLL